MKLTILNDTHIGAQRSAGTTPYTAWQLRQHLNETFKNLVDQIEGALCLNGDLFDTGNVALADVLQTWDTLLSFLNRGGKLVLVQGNHDLNKTLTVLSCPTVQDETYKDDDGDDDEDLVERWTPRFRR